MPPINFKHTPKEMSSINIKSDSFNISDRNHDHFSVDKLYKEITETK